MGCVVGVFVCFWSVLKFGLKLVFLLVLLWSFGYFYMWDFFRYLGFLVEFMGGYVNYVFLVLNIKIMFKIWNILKVYLNVI